MGRAYGPLIVGCYALTWRPVASASTTNVSEILYAYNHKSMTTIVLESTITCPRCGQARQEIMPTDACQYFYECTGCTALLRPKAGDCCVFCSYGSVACPPIQEQRGCCQ